MSQEKRSRALEHEEMPVINLTPMIDVVFQLIIFFMCAMKFKTLENKIEMGIPKHVGLRPDHVVKDVEPVQVLLRQAPGAGVPRIEVFGEEILPDLGRGVAVPPDAENGATARRARAAEERRKAFWARYVDPKFRALEARLRQFRERDPTLRYQIDAGPTVRHEFVVGLIDTFLAAEIEDVTFTGTGAPPPGH